MRRLRRAPRASRCVASPSPRIDHVLPSKSGARRLAACPGDQPLAPCSAGFGKSPRTASVFRKRVMGFQRLTVPGMPGRPSRPCRRSTLLRRCPFRPRPPRKGVAEGEFDLSKPDRHAVCTVNVLQSRSNGKTRARALRRARTRRGLHWFNG